jgi:hypothetical protein
MIKREMLLSHDEADTRGAVVKAEASFPLGLIIAGLAALIATAFATYWSYYKLVQFDANTVGVMGTALGVGGLLSAYLGFAVTFWQLLRTAKSAEAVAKAVRQVKRDYLSFDAMSELNLAKGYNQSIRDSLASRERSSAMIRYDRLRESLVRIAAAPHFLQKKVSPRLKDEAAIILDAMNTLRELVDNDEVPWNAMIGSLESLDSYLISVSETFRSSVSG